MVSIARKNLFHDRVRLVISVGGVAFATMLIMTLIGVYYGIFTESTMYLMNTRADLWVGQEGIHDTWHTYSLLPRGQEDEILQVGGVKDVHEFIGRAVRAKISKVEDKEETIFIIGFDTKSGVGGPWEIVKGKKIPRDGQVIVDRVFALRNNIDIGDKIEVGGMELTVVGISKDTFVLVYSYVFVTKEDATKIFGAEDFLNYYMVEVENPFFAKKVADDVKNRLEKLGVKVDVLTKEEFIDNHKEVIDESFSAILLPLVFIGFFIGVTVIGLTLYTATLEKIKEYAILKAIGANEGFMIKIVLEQAFTIAMLGFVAGTLLSLSAANWVPNIAPEFYVEINVWNIAISFVSIVAMSVAASLIPIRKLEKVDPATVFQA
jgi:putative ABC transport system permease protein